MKLLKQFFILFLTTFLSVSIFAQGSINLVDPNSKSGIPQSKFKPKLRNNGIVFTSAGLATLVGGIVLVAEAGEAYYSYTNNNGTVTEEGSPEGGVGAIMIGLGTLSSIGGTVMWVAGQKKITREKKRAELNFSFYSVSFVYRF